MSRENWPLRLEMLQYLAVRESGGEFPPSVREVAEAVGLKSPHTAHKHLAKLEEHRYVSRAGGKSRQVRLTERGWEALGSAPVLGRIAAGRGLEAVLDESVYPFVSDLLLSANGRRRFMLRVVGDSMLDARIAEGDLLVVEEDKSPEDGEVAVVLVGGGEETTVKRLYRERTAAGEERVRLVAQNPRYEDLVLPASDVSVQGRVLKVIHPPGRP